MSEHGEQEPSIPGMPIDDAWREHPPLARRPPLAARALLGRLPAGNINERNGESGRWQGWDGGRSARPVLVTGATGFIGSRLVSRLLERGRHVRVLALPETVEDLPDGGRIEVIEGGLGDHGQLRRATAGVGLVYHLAALLPGAAEHDLHEVNVLGTQNLLDACAGSRLDRFVLASTVAVYRDVLVPRCWPLNEDSPVGPRLLGPLGAYGWSKYAAEKLVWRAGRTYAFDYCIVRPTAVYGGDEIPLRLPIEALSTRSDAGRSPLPWMLQPVHVDDLVRVLVGVGLAPVARNEVFNVAGPADRMVPLYPFDLQKLSELDWLHAQPRQMAEPTRPRRTSRDSRTRPDAGHIGRTLGSRFPSWGAG